MAPSVACREITLPTVWNQLIAEAEASAWCEWRGLSDLAKTRSRARERCRDYPST